MSTQRASPHKYNQVWLNRPLGPAIFRSTRTHKVGRPVISMRREIKALPDTSVREIAGRDAALWIGEGLGSSSEEAERLRELIQLPWRLVLCEPTSQKLAEAMQTEPDGAGLFRRHHGLLHLIASDPEGLILPQRSLPIYMLNGRIGSSDPAESPSLGRIASQRRRLNMIQRLEAAKPRLLIVLSRDGNPLEDVFDLWQSEFRTLLTVVSDDDQDAERIDGWLSSRGGVVEQCRVSLESLVSDLVPRVSSELIEGHYIVRLQIDADRVVDLDVTDCELIQQPLLDKFELIQSRDLRRMLPGELPQEEFQGFFDKSRRTWIPYAAGLPWRRCEEASRHVLDILRDFRGARDEDNPLVIIASESGAGGTTLAHDRLRRGHPRLPDSRRSRHDFSHRVHRRRNLPL